MKKYITLLLIITLLLTLPAFSQENYQKYLEEAVKFQEEGKFREAIVSLNKALEINPKLDVAYYMLGNIYINDSDYKNGKITFQKLQEIAPEERKALYLIALCDFLNREYISAENNLNKILATKPFDILTRNMLALVLYRNGKSNQSIDEIIKATTYTIHGKGDFTLYNELETYSFDMDKITPSMENIKEISKNNKENPYSYIILAWYAYNENELTEGKDYIKKAIELNPSISLAHYINGLISYFLNDPETSVNEYEHSVKLDSEFTKSIDEKYRYIELAKFDKHIIDLEKKLIKEPENDKILYELAKYYNEKTSLNHALELILKAESLKPQNPDYSNLAGEIYLKKYEYNEAITYFKKACKINEKNPLYLSNLCKALEKGGFFKESLLAGEKAISLGTSDNLIYKSLAISSYYIRDYGKAVNYFKKAIEYDGNNGDLLCRYALTLQIQGKLDEGEKYYKKSIEIMPDLIDSFDNLGITLLVKGNYKEASDYFKKALAMKNNYKSIYPPDFNKIEINLARAFMEEGKNEEALKHLSNVIQKDPVNPTAHLYRAFVYGKLGNKEEREKEFKNVYALISSTSSDISVEELAPYGENTKFTPEYKMEMSYSVTMIDRWTPIYFGEPMFTLPVPGKNESEIKNKTELIYFYLYHRNTDKAFKELQNSKKSLEKWKYHNFYGIIYGQQGKNSLAIAEFNKALEVNPENYEIHNNIGVIYKKLKNFTPAIKHLKKSIKLNFINTWAYNNLGTIYFEQEDYNQAEEAFYFARVSDLTSPWPAHNLSWTYYKSGKIDYATGEMKEAIKLAPKEIIFPAHLGWIYHEKGDIKNALYYYKEALKINPGEGSLYNNMAVALTEEGRYKEAIENYKKAINKKPDEEVYHRNFGITLYKIGNYEEAEKEFLQALNLNTWASENYINIASALFKQGNLEKGMDYLKDGSFHNEKDYSLINDIIILNNQGAVYLEQGKLDLAENQFQNVINYRDTYKELEKELADYYVDTCNNMALLKYKKELKQEALDLLHDGLRLNPLSGITLNNLGIIEDNSKEYHEKAIKLEPFRGLFYNNLGVFYFKHGESPKAKETLKDGLRKDKNAFIISYNLGGIYLTENIFKEAIAEFSAIPDTSDLYTHKYYFLGFTHYKEGNKKLAEDYFRKAVSKEKLSRKFSDMGWSFLGFSAYELAVEKFTMAIQLNPKNADACVGLAISYFNLGNMEKVKENAQKGIELEPHNEKAYSIIALFYYQEGNFKTALENLKKAVEINPENAMVKYNYAYMLQETGEIKKAIELYKEVISLDATSSLALSSQGFINFYEKKYEEAKDSAYQAIQNDMTFSDAYYILGKVFEQEGNSSQALFEYERVLKSDPRHLEAKKSIERINSKLHKI